MGEENVIWDRITQSAMSKFDYAAFRERLKSATEDETVAENIVFLTIIEFASGKSEDEISELLYNQIVLSGFVWEFEEIQRYVEDKKQTFSIEIYAVSLAYTLLEETKDPAVVLTAVNQLL
jgi:hypothetical protein